MATNLSPNSIVVALGTRPEVIKLAGIIRLLGPSARLVHTGQHFDAGLSDVFFSEFGLPQPDLHLGIGGSTRAAQIGATASGLEAAFAEDRPRAIVVQGDTNTTLGTSLAANSLHVPLVHIEAGLRSFDRRMPEEHNRVLADHLSDLCCAPTSVARDNLTREGIKGSRVVITGNTIVEAVEEILPDAAARTRLVNSYGVERFVLATLHRPENVDDEATLATVLDELGKIPIPVVLPVHPRTAKRIADFGLQVALDRIHAVDPIGYREFLGLAAEADLLISDSGGLQEEASIIKRPLIVVRRSTERPEVLGTFVRLVQPGPDVSTTASEWLVDIEARHHELEAIPTPYGDGTASQQSVAAIQALLDP
jgi:UDP-N-acetylglucosamine 2-epimerase (non-hydrolysing)